MVSLRVRRKFVVVAGGCLLASLIFAWAAPNLLRRRLADCERSVSTDLQQIDEAVRAYITTHGTAPPTLSSLRGHIPSAWSCEASTCDDIGYRFEYTASLQGPGGPRYSLSARPLKHGISGVYSYYLDETSILRCTKEPRAAKSDDRPMPDCRE